MKIWKKVTWIFFCAVLFLGEAWGREESQETIKVGYYKNAAVVRDLNSIDHKGFGYDLLLASEKYSDVSFEFIHVTPETLEASLKAGVIDLFGGMAWSEETAEEYIYSDSFGVMEILLVAKEDSPILYLDTEKMDGESVSILSSFQHQELLDTFLEEHDISLDLVEVNSAAEFQLSDTTLHLTVDFFEVFDKKVVAKLSTEYLYFIAPPSGQWAIEAVNESLLRLDESEPWLRSEVYGKYLQNNNMAKPVLTVEQQDLLLQHGEFTVGFAENLFPLEGVDSAGNPDGIIVQLMDILAEKAGISLKYLPFPLGEDVNYSYFDLSIVYAGDDGYMSEFTMSEAVPGSPPLLLVAESGLKDPKTEVSRIGMLPYRTFDFDGIYKKYSNSELIIYYTYEEMVKDIKNGVIDGILVSNITAGYLLLELGETHYDSYNTNLFLPFRIFISKDMPEEFVEIFNILLAQLDEDLVEKLKLDQVSKFYIEPTFLQRLEDYWLLYLFAVAGFFFSVFALILVQQKKKQEEFLNAVNVDDLTGLLSEVKFLREVKKMLLQDTGMKYRLMALDVDQFSLINRQYGNRSGNLILKKIAFYLRDNYPEQALICRSHGDLFYVFTPVTSELRAFCGKAFCDQCLVNTASSVLLIHYPLSISRGTYTVEDTAIDLEFMIKAANMARLLGKSTYGMTNFEYTKELDEKRVLHDDILSNMEQALESRGLRVHYQVKVDVKSGHITGAEALVRWFHLDEENKPMSIRYMPDDFIGLFEENGFITKLDYYVLREVCQFIAKNRANPYFPKIAMNLSGLTLLRKDLFSMLEETLDRYNVFPQEIDFEITESAFTHYPEESAERVLSLRELGFSIVMDDFGTGASSLNRLKDMEINGLKLDKSFLDYNLNEKKGSIIVGNIISMSKKIGATVVAEGVETHEQLESLRKLDCDEVQGFYFAKPLSEEDCLELCREKVCLSREKRNFLKSTNRYLEQGNLRPSWDSQDKSH